MKDANPNTTPFHAPIAEQIWDMKYRFKDDKGQPIDHVVEDTWSRIAGALSAVEPEGKRESCYLDFYEALKDFKFLPAGRITAGAGTGRAVTLFNCYVMGTIPDSMDGIFTMLREAALTMQQGGGIGYDFSTIRPKTSRVKKLGADASGPLSFMDVWDAMCRTVMSAGSRRGAMMATMRCDHPDIEDFITAKQDSARLRMFNLSVLVTDDFMDKVAKDQTWFLEHDEPPMVSPFGEEKPRKNGTTGKYVHKVMKARDLWAKIMRATYDYAEPGVIFIDRINKSNNLNYIETIAATNPCGEQPLPPYGACLLGSINLAALVEDAYGERAGIPKAALKKLVATAIRMMDNVVDASNFPLEAQQEEARNKRRLGLGVTGLANALMMCGKVYGSEEAVETTEVWLREIAIAAYEASIELAKEKGPFPLFDAEGFLAEGTFACERMPDHVKTAIKAYGIRNSHLLSIAPTGTISLYAGNLSGGVEPVFAPSYVRKVLQNDGSKVEERVVDFGVAAWENLPRDKTEVVTDGELPTAYVDAQSLDPIDHLKMQAVAQKWVDSSISKTINLPEDISFDDFERVYQHAYDMGCKGCTTYRPNEVTGSVLSVEEKPKEPALWADNAAFLVAAQDAVDRLLTDMGHTPGREHWLSVRELFGVERESDIPEEKRQDYLDYLASYEVTDEPVEETIFMSGRQHGKTATVEAALKEAMTGTPDWSSLPDPLTKRPDTLPGQTYKIKLGGDPALYVTVTDIIDASGRRPFEVFINAKNPEHIAWTNALAMMISAIFRRPHDSSFVVEELKGVFDPKGGGFWQGAYRPSVVAAIGQVIENHMRDICYGPWGAERPVTQPEAMSAPYEGLTGLADPADAVQAFASAASCPNCHGFNMKIESGCATCLDCGHSKCG